MTPRTSLIAGLSLGAFWASIAGIIGGENVSLIVLAFSILGVGNVALKLYAEGRRLQAAEDAKRAMRRRQQHSVVRNLHPLKASR
jgi:hypothetical protein